MNSIKNVHLGLYCNSLLKPYLHTAICFMVDHIFPDCFLGHGINDISFLKCHSIISYIDQRAGLFFNSELHKNIYK